MVLGKLGCSSLTLTGHQRQILAPFTRDTEHFLSPSSDKPQGLSHSQEGANKVLLRHLLKNCSLGDWGGSLLVKSSCCSYRGPRFSSQHSHDSSQPSVTLVPGDQIPSSGLHGHYMHVVDIYIGKTFTCIKEINTLKKKMKAVC